MQPLIRSKVTHDPASMEGQSYVSKVLCFKIETSGSGAEDFYTVHDGDYVEEVIAIITTAMDTGTVDIGDEDTAAKFIANNELTETSRGSVASSKQTTLPDGHFYTAVKTLKATIGGIPTEGEVMILLKLWETIPMVAHQEIEVTDFRSA